MPRAQSTDFDLRFAQANGLKAAITAMKQSVAGDTTINPLDLRVDGNYIIVCDSNGSYLPQPAMLAMIDMMTTPEFLTKLVVVMQKQAMDLLTTLKSDFDKNLKKIDT